MFFQISTTSRFNSIALTILAASVIMSSASGQIINEDLKLLANDGESLDSFGVSVAIDNGIVAVGATGDDDNGGFSGSVYLYDAVTGVQTSKLVPSDGQPGDNFGWSIAADNGIIAIGAYHDDDNGSNAGSAYLFNASTGAQILKLLPTDGATGDSFGVSIAIDNGIVAVGAFQNDDNGDNDFEGAVYLFDAITGVQLEKLLANDGADNDRFGHAVAINNGIVAVGSYKDDDNGTDSGSAYLFDAATGMQLAKLLPSDGDSFHFFGYSIAIDTDIVAVGAYLDDDNGTATGSAYLFDTITGAQFAKLVPGDAIAGDNFGWSIAADNGMVAVGARFATDNGSDSGSGYLFDGATGDQLTKLLPTDGAANDFFGYAIAIDNQLVACGARSDDDSGSSSGSSYVFTVPAMECLADVNGDGAVSPADFTAWIAAFNANAPECDQNGDGSCTAADFTAWIANFNAGC